MAANEPLSITRILNLFDDGEDAPDRDQIKTALEELDVDMQGRGVELKQVSSGYRFQVRQEYSLWVGRLQEDKPARYSRALLETLAIIAYRQPITRSEIEDIRGVSVSSNIVKTLQERGWVRIVGHRDVPGKPALIATTREFLDYFNLKKLSELPSLAEIKDFDQMNPDLFEGLEKQETEENVDEASAENPVDVSGSGLEDEADVQAEASELQQTDEKDDQSHTEDIADSDEATEIENTTESEDTEEPEAEIQDSNVVPISG